MDIIKDVEDEFEKIESDLSPKAKADIKTAENDGHAIEHSAVAYIETNGLQDLYAIALELVGSMAPGASWTVTVAAIAAKATADGVKLIQGAEAVVAGQAQADLLAAGKITL